MPNAFTFNGSTDYLQLPDLASVGDFTFACKFNWGGSVGQDSLWSPDNYPTSPRSFILTSIANSYATPAGNALLGGQFNGALTSPNSLSPSPPSASSPHDMVVVRSGGNFTYYLDGVSYAAFTDSETGAIPLSIHQPGSGGVVEYPQRLLRRNALASRPLAFAVVRDRHRQLSRGHRSHGD